MFEFRVTKYNPTNRDSNGWYLREEWTAISDIGRSFGGVVLTELEYQRVEDAYATAAVAFMRDAGIESLEVTDLENGEGGSQQIRNGSILRLTDVDAVVRKLLREEFWCRLQSAEGFIHVGYDYYMYVGVSKPCVRAEDFARRAGLFVEAMPSPYRDLGPPDAP